MIVRFGELGWDTLNRQAKAEGWSITELARIAVGHYLDQVDRNPDRQALIPPRGAVDVDDLQAAEPKRGPFDLEVELSESEADRLDGEAARLGCEPEFLAKHAFLLFAADLDSGLVAEQVAEEAEVDPKVVWPGRSGPAA